MKHEALPERKTGPRVLVTGATGFIGSRLAELLVEQGAAVRCLVRRTSDVAILEQLGVEFVYGDLRDPEALSGCLDDVEVVYHVAGITAAARASDFFESNARATANVVDACVRHGTRLRRLVYVSSLAAAGPSPDRVPLREDEAPRPVSAYGRSKLAGERAVLGARDRLGVTVVRPPIVYGPRDRDIYKFFRLISLGVVPHVGRRERYNSIVYVDDLVHGLVLAATRDEAAGQTYFVADEQYYSRTELAKHIARAVGVADPRPLVLPESVFYGVAVLVELFMPLIGDPSIINRDKVRESIEDYWLCDVTKAKRQLGYRARVGVAEGTQRAADWYRAQGWL